MEVAKCFAYRDTASFGRRQEFIAAAEFLKCGFDVYMTLVDDQGIDCIVRLDQHRYVDIQIEARSRDAKNWNRFARLSFEPRANLFFILMIERTARYRIIPSTHLADLGRRNKTGKNKGCVTVNVPKLLAGNKHDRFKCYETDCGFDVLRAFEMKRPATSKVPAPKFAKS
jgi:hypothetical protein